MNASTPGHRRNDLLFPDLIGNFFTSFDDLFSDRFRKITIPAANITENDRDYRLTLAAPGLSKDDFYIDVDQGRIIISVQKENEENEEKPNYSRQEYNYTSFVRSFALPDAVKQEDIHAEYKDGVLVVVLPKKETEAGAATRIPIQ